MVDLCSDRARLLLSAMVIGSLVFLLVFDDSQIMNLSLNMNRDDGQQMGSSMDNTEYDLQGEDEALGELDPDQEGVEFEEAFAESEDDEVPIGIVDEEMSGEQDDDAGFAGRVVNVTQNATATRVNIDWLHIPKTGTSFLYSLLLYKCDGVFTKKYGPGKHETENMKKVSLNVRAGKATPTCTRGLRYHHAGLSSDLNNGHGSSPVQNVVTMVRPPTSRIASGLVNVFHDCGPLNRNGMSHKQVCKILTNPNATKSDYIKARDRTIEYGKCVQGCGARMMSGHKCDHFGRQGFSDDTVTKAIEKMQNFAFVGLTDRWSESTCLFRKMFPRPSGRDYPSETLNDNVRPTVNKNCEDYVSEILEEEGFHEGPDQKVYDAAVTIFEKRLAKHPECSPAA